MTDTPISAPSAPLPHHLPQGAETALNPHRRTPSHRGAGVRCGNVGAVTERPSAPQISPHLGRRVRKRGLDRASLAARMSGSGDV